MEASLAHKSLTSLSPPCHVLATCRCVTACAVRARAVAVVRWTEQQTEARKLIASSESSRGCGVDRAAEQDDRAPRLGLKAWIAFAQLGVGHAVNEAKPERLPVRSTRAEHAQRRRWLRIQAKASHTHAGVRQKRIAEKKTPLWPEKKLFLTRRACSKPAVFAPGHLLDLRHAKTSLLISHP